MIGRIIDRFRSRETSAPATTSMPPLAPASPFAVIGDIHGRADLLDLLLARLDQEMPIGPVILVGDYIDRGEDSAAVLTRLCAATTTPACRLVCLSGNHEDMCLRFLDDPDRHGPMWLRNGGLQTLASFGIGGVGPSSAAPALAKARDALAVRMGDNMINWLRALPVSWQSGNIAVVHAGADPALPLDAQKRATLLWGHKDFVSRPRFDGLWIVHGHTIVAEPVSVSGRIAVDTGAYATGKLSAAILTSGAVRFLTAP